MIPERFVKRIDEHLLGNYIQVEKFPLILAIIGEPGMGKSYQLRQYLREQDVTVFSVNAADLESDRAGLPAKILREKYMKASFEMEDNKPAALVIDDIDTTLGEWENYTGTVNHQDIIAFLMHIADNPRHIEDSGDVNRVPIFFTGNCFDRLYAPLVREGRADRFIWRPTEDEIADIICSHYSLSSRELAKAFIKRFPSEKLSFYTSYLEHTRIEHVQKNNTLCFAQIIEDSDIRQQLRDEYDSLTGDQIIMQVLEGNIL